MSDPSFFGLGRPSSLNSDSPFAIADHALHDTTTPIAPKTVTPRPKMARPPQQQGYGQGGGGGPVPQQGYRTTPPPQQERGGYPAYQGQQQQQQQQYAPPPQQQQAGPSSYPSYNGGSGGGGNVSGGGYQSRPTPPPQQQQQQGYPQRPSQNQPYPPQYQGGRQQDPSYPSYSSQSQPPRSSSQPIHPPPPHNHHRQQQPPPPSVPAPAPSYSSQTPGPAAYHQPQPTHAPHREALRDPPASSGSGSYRDPPPPQGPIRRTSHEVGQQQGYVQGGQGGQDRRPASANSAGGGTKSSGPTQGGTEAELWNLFASMDISQSGQLSAKEVTALLSRDRGPGGGGGWKIEPREDCVKMLMNIFDTDRSGSINFSEFEGLYRYIKDWHAIFNRFDRDQSGTIDRRELEQALKSFGFPLPGDLVRKLEKRFAPPKTDPNTPRGITFDRFLMACVTVKHFSEAFRKRDVRGEGRLTLDYNSFMELVIEAPS